MAFLASLCCALFAAAAAARARGFGVQFTGAAVLSCACGLAGPLCCYALLYGSPGALHVFASFPAWAFGGAMLGIGAEAFFKKRREAVFFWLESASAGLASSWMGVVSFPALGAAGCVMAAVACAAAPGFLRDSALGDMALFVEKNWRAASAIIGCVFALLVLSLSFFWKEFPRAEELAAMAGWLVSLGASWLGAEK